MIKVTVIITALVAACHVAAVESIPIAAESLPSTAEFILTGEEYIPPPQQRNANASFASYYIYTRDNSRYPEILTATEASAMTASVVFRPKTAVIVHGHEGSGFSSLNPTVKDAFLTSEDVNVIVVDWYEFARRKYDEAVNLVPIIGEELAQLITQFSTYQRIGLDRLHLVGFDLGAHIVGYTGRALGGNVARITGLDPAGKKWNTNSERLSKTDAQYVEVIHTDGSGLLANGIGEALGHVDFFANGGCSQPGCLTNSCSHERAWMFFAATLTHDHLIGNQCTSMLQVYTNRCRGFQLAMGNNEFIKYGSGIYRANTGRTYPY